MIRGESGLDLSLESAFKLPFQGAVAACYAPFTMTERDQLSHIDSEGRSRMVDVGDKAPTRRHAQASGRLLMSPATRELVLQGEIPKGNVVEVARIAGIQAAKRTADLIPMCHPLRLSRVDVRVEVTDEGLLVTSEAACAGPTGVEMEALTAVSVALLTLYDMCKAVERGMTIADVRLERKSGGASGTWKR
jgi:cyclic pyranopterin phosphate synthase